MYDPKEAARLGETCERLLDQLVLVYVVLGAARLRARLGRGATTLRGGAGANTVTMAPEKVVLTALEYFSR